ncbi:DEAD/DEAH box helicase [Nocardia sp. NPDC088792]|uniref:DEAD/DEAH box helicase n=1 Tax=Nocardia sp. NPDC088792 TaxID=3364332 RepID=UPI00381D53F6
MNSASPSFAALGVREPLVRTLTRAGITEPFPIQTSTLRDSLAGRDVLGRGRTGSGKTLAFSIPMVERLSGELAGARIPKRPAGLVLAPTRELATQIAAALEPLASAYRMTVTTIFGGVPQNRQVRALKNGVDIVVACPGRLEDLMKQGAISLDAVEITVIDEADHMADLGFLPGVTRILAATPSDGQRLLFSATLDNGVDKLVKRFLPQAVRHSVDEATSPVAAMTHHVFEASGVEPKREIIEKLASGTGRRILFTRTKHQARRLAKQLTVAGIPAVDLHGNLSQAARDRNLATFAAGKARVLVATDVAARGVHVDGVELVVHVDPPADHKAYLHRSGRTARAGNAGDVITLVLPAERRDLAALMRKAAIDVTPQKVNANSPAVAELVGDVAPLVAPSRASREELDEPRRPAAAPRRRNGGGAPRRGEGAAQGDRSPRQRTGSAAQGEGGARRRSGGAAQGNSGAPRRGGSELHRGGAGAARNDGGPQQKSRGERDGRTGANSASTTRHQRPTSGGQSGRRGGAAAPAGSTGGLSGFSRAGGGGRRRG